MTQCELVIYNTGVVNTLYITSVTKDKVFAKTRLTSVLCFLIILCLNCGQEQLGKTWANQQGLWEFVFAESKVRMLTRKRKEATLFCPVCLRIIVIVVCNT